MKTQIALVFMALANLATADVDDKSNDDKAAKKFEGIFRAVDENHLSYAQTQIAGLAVQITSNISMDEELSLSDRQEQLKAAQDGEGTFFKIISVTKDTPKSRGSSSIFAYLNTNPSWVFTREEEKKIKINIADKETFEDGKINLFRRFELLAPDQTKIGQLVVKTELRLKDPETLVKTINIQCDKEFVDAYKNLNDDNPDLPDFEKAGFFANKPISVTYKRSNILYKNHK